MKKPFLSAADNAEPAALDGMFDGVKPEKVSKKTVLGITERIVRDNGKSAKKLSVKRLISVTASVLCFSLLIMAVALMLNSAGKIKALDLMQDIEPQNLGRKQPVSEADAAKVTDFAVRLFKQSAQSKDNALISPLSLLCALAMTANGAEGETLEQTEQTLGMSKDELNTFFRSYLDSLKNNENCKFELANSVWFKDGFTVDRGFLQCNADHYGASAYQTPFDKSALHDINNWANNKTDGMIREILDKIPEDAVMYLVNALCFDAEWENKFKFTDIHNAEFTKETGEKCKVKMMSSEETVYLDDGKATGFLKYYKGRRYAFAAMLPNEGVTLDEYIASLDGQAVYGMLSDKTYISVGIQMPKFKYEYGAEMSDTLKSMGMSKAFDGGAAEFNGIGKSDRGNIFINSVIHKTYISVDEAGTKAGAITVIEMGERAGGPSVFVTLDRPFVYMLVDTETNIPFFIGTVTDIS